MLHNRFHSHGMSSKMLLSVLIVLVLTLSMSKALLADELEEMQTVVVIVLYTPDCDACQVVLNEVLPPLESHYNGRLETFALDVSLPVHDNAIRRLSAELGDAWSDRQLPVVLVGDQVLVGQAQIETELPDFVSRYSLEGGAAYPPTYHPSVEEGFPEPADIALIGSNLVCGMAVLVLLVAAFSLRSQLSKERQRKYPKPSTRPARAPRPRTEVSPDRTLLALMGLADNSVDLLNECIRFLHLRGRRNKDSVIADATGLIQNLLEVVARVSGIAPVEKYGATVEYNSRYHTAYESVEPRESVKVIETGWKHGQHILRNAVVKKLR